MPDYNYLEDLTDAELEALRVEVASRCSVCQVEVEDLQDALDDASQAEENAQQTYEDTVEAVVQIPTVVGETSVSSGGSGPDVVEFIAIDIPVGAVVSTGNGDDGIGVLTSWDVPEELRLNFNILVFVSGEKVGANAQILEADYIGGIPDFQDSILVSDDGVIIPDLFDPEVERSPDQTFFVGTGPKAFEEVFTVRVFAEVPNQTFDVSTFAKPADQIFSVESIRTYGISVAEPPFLVEVGPEVPDQIFSTRTSATPPDRTFVVNRGAEIPSQVFEVLTGNTFEVFTSFAPPDRTFYVQLGPPPARDPDQIFGVSVGGPDAPPIPDPFQIFDVSTSWATPDRVLDIKVITNRVVDAFEAPFSVTVGPEAPSQVFEVITSAIPYDQLFSFEVGPEIPTQIYDTAVIQEFEVDAYERRVTYQIQESNISGDENYIVSGEGLEFAVEPEIALKVGQMAHLYVNTPGNALWIKDVQEAGAGELDPYFVSVTNQGTTNKLVKAQFLQSGTFYYQSEFNAEAFGVIEVTGVSSAAPDQIFDVFVGADPTGFSELFDVTVGPEFPDEVFVVDIQNEAPPVHQIFESTVGPELPLESFEVLSATAPLSYNVTNSGAGSYLFSGNGLSFASNPTLNLEVGQMLEIAINAAGHPFYVSDSNSSGVKDSVTPYIHDIVGQGAALGAIRVIFSQPGTYYYNCGFHAAMSGEIVVTGVGMDQKIYTVSQAQDRYTLSGEGLLNESNPTISVGVSETLFLSVVAPDQPVYIKRAPGTGTEVQSPDFMQLLVRQGTTDGLMKMRFLLPGTYYYASSNDQKFGGVIEVTA
ncbi:hypothetical protein SynSYN20_01661 [Synechococcus sp. SYN20]|uniref:cupredoxin domain-containing protein n=1 Tax=Synechococcus sp. SYN20 TaxID=1050714 RepID=UPI00164639C7|nr:hypothetical protein [Synechococcus sp. SYN20]QNJ25988.1 hypothetical protein SynSYN20_01661 [Synechococcus sp. SYN20]